MAVPTCIVLGSPRLLFAFVDCLGVPTMLVSHHLVGGKRVKRAMCSLRRWWQGFKSCLAPQRHSSQLNLVMADQIVSDMRPIVGVTGADVLAVNTGGTQPATLASEPLNSTKLPLPSLSIHEVRTYVWGKGPYAS